MVIPTLADQVKSLIDEGADALPHHSLPEALRAQFENVMVLQAELETLRDTLAQRGGRIFGIGRRMTSLQKRNYQERISLIEAELQGLHRVAQVMRLGYQPYTLPDNWFAGYAERCNHWNHNLVRSDLAVMLDWEFQAPMPAGVIDKHQKAKKTGLFDAFIVGTPDRELFRQAGSFFADPVLIGYVATGRGRVGLAHKLEPGTYHRLPGLVVQGGTGFLIDMWGLEKDRQTGGLS